MAEMANHHWSSIRWRTLLAQANTVRKRTANGGWYHGPPYTWEEEMDLHRRMDHCSRSFIGRAPRREA
jgi:hypothetical protein